MINLRLLKISDFPLWICVALLILFSFFVIFSATSGKVDSPFIFLQKHFVALVLGIIFLALFAFFDYIYLKMLSPLLYVFMLATLGAVLFIGNATAGAQRWFNLGIFNFQPSELAKLIIIFGLAAYLHNKKGKIKSLLQFLPILLIVGIPFLLIFKQPDLGTSLVVIAITLGMLVWAEVSIELLLLLITPFFSILFSQFIYLWIIYILLLSCFLFLIRIDTKYFIYIVALNIIIGLAFPFIWNTLKEYQRQRIMSFINPAADPLGAGYHSLQSRIAVGSGGIFGKGFLKGTQTQLQFIPVQHSDFIFSALSEEFGFIGVSIVMAMLWIIAWRAIKIAGSARDFFGSLLACGIAVMYIFHILVNIGMCIGIMPVVGIPLPFMSYGGTFLMINLVSVGILQNIAMRRQKLVF